MSEMTQHQEDLIELLFDAITGTNCLTHEDIAIAGGFAGGVPDVGKALSLIRDPDNAIDYGWTVPHVPRGKPRDGQVYRYQVLDASAGTPLTPEQIGLIREGALCTVRLIATETRNEANALRTSSMVTTDKRYKKWAANTATILEGVSTQATLEADRLIAILAMPPVAATP